MLNWVNGEGPASKLIVVGEAPGARENETGKPFIGPSGQLLNQILSECGIQRSEVYVTNVVKLRPPDNDFSRVNETGYSLDYFEQIMWDEIRTIEPNVVLALGNNALKSLTGKTGITNYRGSILQSKEGYPKVVSTLHPANFIERHGEGGALFKWSQLAYVKFDVRRAIEQSGFREFKLPDRNLWVCRSSLDLLRFIERNKNKKRVAVDIETYRTIPVCIGLSFEPSEAISIPLTDLQSGENPKGIILDEMIHMWDMVSELLYDESIGKVGQYFKFDQGKNHAGAKTCLAGINLFVRGFVSDVLMKFHTVYPEFPKNLAFMASILTEEPFWKSERKDFNPKKDDPAKLYLYNAKDAAVTIEVDAVLEDEIKEYGVEDFFYGYVMRLHDLYRYIEDQGIKADKDQYEKVRNTYLSKRDTLQAELNELAGYEINPDSNPQICNFLYNELRCPQRTRRRKGGKSTLTADEKAIQSLLTNVIKDEPRRKVLICIQKNRAVTKTLGTYLGVQKDKPVKKKVKV